MADWAPIQLPVDEVTLQEDRAHAVRRGTVTLQAGINYLRVEGVTPLLSDRTLSAALRGGDGPRVNDVQLRRRVLALPAERPEKIRELEKTQREMQEQETALRQRIERLSLQEAELDQLADAAVDDLAMDAAWDRFDRAAWGQQLDALATDERSARDARLGRQRELSELRRDLRNLGHRIAAALQPSDRIEAELRLEVSVDTAGDYQLRVDYLVAGACWRPYHRARLEGDQITFSTEGCAWQNTGEDWDDVTLLFSTARPSLGTEPPDLSSDLLTVRKKQEVLQVQAREQAIQTTGLGGAATTPELPGIDDGGEVVSLRGQHRSTVPSDGRPDRVPLSQFTTTAETERVAMPELVEAVLFKSVQVNGGATPILAGPVDLVRGGGTTGRTSVLYIAPGERFALGWGPDGALRVRREVDVSAEDSGMLSSWIKRDTTVTLRLSNLGDEPRTVAVRERVPVSEIDKVKIEVNEQRTTDRKLPDDDGILDWSVSLQPAERRRVKLTYTLKKHSDVQGV